MRNHFTIANFDTLPRTKFFFFSREVFGIRPSLCWLHVWKISSLKDSHKKRYLKSTNMCSCKGQFQTLLPTLIYILVDLKKNVLCEVFELEICRTCYQHRDNFFKKKFMASQKNSILGRVSKLAIIKLFVTTTPVGRFRISFLE